MSKSDWKHIRSYKNEFIEGTAVAIIWSIDDIFTGAQNKGMKITTSEAIDVLTRLYEKHDATLGISWDTIDFLLDDYI